MSRYYMSMSNTLEIITATEALTRVGLAGLDLGGRGDTRVEWTGYPTPMACGHYSDGERVSRHSCGGNTLFSWDRPDGDTVGALHVVINPESLADRYGNHAPCGAKLSASWSGH